MDARTYWQHYVDQNDGPVSVAKRLGIPYSTIAGICNGSRGIGHNLAQRMAQADPLLDASKLIWVRSSKPKPDTNTAAA